MPLFPDQSGSLACRLPLSVHQGRRVLGPKMYIGCCHKPERLKRGSCQIMILPFRTAIEVSNLNRLYMESIAFYSVPSRSLANMFSTKEELQNTNFSKSLTKNANWKWFPGAVSRTIARTISASTMLKLHITESVTFIFQMGTSTQCTRVSTPHSPLQGAHACPHNSRCSLTPCTFTAPQGRRWCGST